MESNVLLLSPLKKGWGNYSTIQRISSYLGSERLKVLKRDPRSFVDETELQCYVVEMNISLIVGLHAYRSGQLLSKKVHVPYIIIFAGTDINEFSKDAEKLKTMSRAVASARFIVAFNAVMLERAFDLWPEMSEHNTAIIQQAVETNPSQFCLRDHLYNGGRISEEQRDVKIFLFVGGIRPVKNPLFLVQEFEDWHRSRQDILFVILGPKGEDQFQTMFENVINKLQGVVYVNELCLEDTHACIKDSFALVNSSDSEGMAAAILEAMNLEVPVIARNNDGNRVLINDGKNGLLFSDEKEFRCKAEFLLDNDDQRTAMVRTAKEHMDQYHSKSKEREQYNQLISSILC